MNFFFFFSKFGVPNLFHMVVCTKCSMIMFSICSSSSQFCFQKHFILYPISFAQSFPLVAKYSKPKEKESNKSILGVLKVLITLAHLKETKLIS
jgi:hypothetical protein